MQQPLKYLVTPVGKNKRLTREASERCLVAFLVRLARRTHSDDGLFGHERLLTPAVDAGLLGWAIAIGATSDSCHSFVILK